MCRQIHQIPSPNFSTTLVDRFASIIPTCRGNATTMEMHAKALADLTMAIAALTAKINDIHPQLRSEVSTLRAQISKVSETTPTDRAKELPPSPPLRLADLPPLLP
ncbi:hypothetical protein ZWY2020_044001 [Hordeum vulgare]|nr:hypothetical protein ZWY2020_044001 [Hordeum vulgare]